MRWSTRRPSGINGHLLVNDWGYGSDLLAVDQRSGTTRRLYRTAVADRTAGRNGAIGLVQDGYLVVMDSEEDAYLVDILLG